VCVCVREREREREREIECVCMHHCSLVTFSNVIALVYKATAEHTFENMRNTLSLRMSTCQPPQSQPRRLFSLPPPPAPPPPPLQSRLGHEQEVERVEEAESNVLGSMNKPGKARVWLWTRRLKGLRLRWGFQRMSECVCMYVCVCFQRMSECVCMYVCVCVMMMMSFICSFRNNN
jgi:hypothetical protein